MQLGLPENLHNFGQSLFGGLFRCLVVIVLFDVLELFRSFLVLLLEVVQFILQVGDILVRVIGAQRILDLLRPALGLTNHFLGDILLVAQLGLEMKLFYYS